MRPCDVSWSHGQPFCFHPPNHEIFSCSHGEMTMMNTIHKILQTINIQPGTNMMISCSHSDTIRCVMVSWSTLLFSPTSPKDFSWSHGEITIIDNIKKIIKTINMQPGENMMISLSHILTVRP